MSTLRELMEARGRSPSPKTKAEEWKDTIATGIVAPPQPDHPPSSPLVSPHDEGNLRKRLGGQVPGDSATLNTQGSMHNTMTGSASNPNPTGIENHPPTTNRVKNNTRPPIETRPSQRAMDASGNTLATNNRLSSSTLPAGSPGVAGSYFPDYLPDNGGAPSHREDVPNCDGLDDDMRLWVRRSPAGFHITDVARFMNSPYTAPNVRNRTYTRGVLDDYNPDPRRAIDAYNKSREDDRICPACHTWFRVGEKVFESPDNFQEFCQRPSPPLQFPNNVLKYIAIQRVFSTTLRCNEMSS
ncbi:hypothetical protein DL95DRAFT_460468 [Leptodontidium sp. 2 PMI_412]|nr:hypothetical protein DL95DRAFT_460468 [Leptodontidium sp. 2 PMI_412]